MKAPMPLLMSADDITNGGDGCLFPCFSLFLTNLIGKVMFPKEIFTGGCYGLLHEIDA
jgi:hypothetical protein